MSMRRIAIFKSLFAIRISFFVQFGLCLRFLAPSQRREASGAEQVQVHIYGPADERRRQHRKLRDKSLIRWEFRKVRTGEATMEPFQQKRASPLPLDTRPRQGDWPGDGNSGGPEARTVLYAGLESARTSGRRPRAFMACHRSHFAWSVNQIVRSHRVSASNKSAVSALNQDAP